MVRLLGRVAFPPHGLKAQRFPRHILYDYAYQFVHKRLRFRRYLTYVI